MPLVVHHLNCGTLCPLAARLVHGRGRLFGRGMVVCHCLLIETERDGLVLVDTGLGTREIADSTRLPLSFNWFFGPRRALAETAIQQVRALGFATSDVRHIITTHLDPDHAGGLADFPGAAVHVHAAELRAVDAARRRERSRYVAAQWAHRPRWHCYDDAGDDWLGFAAVRQLSGVAADIALVPLFGHSRGHSGVAIRQGSGWLLHAGDAFFDQRELERPAEVPIGLRLFTRLNQVDPVARAHNLRRLRRCAERHAGVEIVCSHDPGRFAAGAAAARSNPAKCLGADFSSY